MHGIASSAKPGARPTAIPALRSTIPRFNAILNRLGRQLATIWTKFAANRTSCPRYRAGTETERRGQGGTGGGVQRRDRGGSYELVPDHHPADLYTGPPAADRETLETITGQLRANNHDRIATVAELARHFGLRFREASLFNAREALQQARQSGRISIIEGTKGGRGREADRWVPVPPESLPILAAAADLQGNRRNLLPDGQSFRQWRDHAYYHWRLTARPTGVRGFHTLRAAYACERYRQLTGCPPPVMAQGRRIASDAADRQARTVLAHELGHGPDRIDVVSDYIGGR